MKLFSLLVLTLLFSMECVVLNHAANAPSSSQLIAHKYLYKIIIPFPFNPSIIGVFMASGITHILLIKNLQNVIPEDDLKMVLAAERDFLQVGAIAPDLPYASIADDDFFLTTQSDLADKFHYVKTNEIPLQAFIDIRNIKNTLTPRELRAHFAFFLGYASHVIADGIIHPFVRDKVGNYKENQTAHRVLEMQLDVLFFHSLTLNSNHPTEFNNSNIHDELINLSSDFYPERDKVIEEFSRLIKKVYNDSYDVNTILGWVKGLHRMFGVAEGEPAIYRDIPFVNNFMFSNYDELLDKYDNILILKSKKEGGNNFAQKDHIHFLNDVVPQFYKKFIPFAQKAYNFIYNDGEALTNNDISGIDLDTGRILAQNNNLDLIPYYWS
jgi:hypothetical protein